MKDDRLLKTLLELYSEDIEIHQFHFENFTDIMFSLIVDRVKQNNTEIYGQRLYHINLLTQKFIAHCFSVKKLLQGIKLESKNEKLEIDIVDPFSINCLVRVILENYLVINYLSNSKVDTETLDCRFEIWMRYGLKQRKVSADNNEDIQRIIDIDTKSIKALEDSIKLKKCYLKLSSDKKESFLKTINSEWKIIFKGEKFHPSSWKTLIDEAEIKEGTNDNIYNFLSWHSHSQSISVLQFGDMWMSGDDKKTIKLTLKKLNMFISFMILDIVKVDKDILSAFNRLNQESKNLINTYNYLFRNETLTIE